MLFEYCFIFSMIYDPTHTFTRNVYTLTDLLMTKDCERAHLAFDGNVYIPDNVLITYDILFNMIKCDLFNQIMTYSNIPCCLIFIEVYMGNDKMSNVNPNKLKFNIDITEPFYLHKLIENVI